MADLHVRAEAGDLPAFADDGIGIPTHTLTQIFEMFAHDARNLERSQGGLGIGLSIVRRLVELHGGSNEARSDGDGRGSELVVRLPVDLSGDGPEPLDEATVARPTAACHILVLDDNVDSAESLATCLTMQGHETRMAHDELEASDVAAAFRPPVMLLGNGAPKLDGVIVCRRIRQEAGEPMCDPSSGRRGGSASRACSSMITCRRATLRTTQCVPSDDTTSI